MKVETLSHGSFIISHTDTAAAGEDTIESCS